MAIYLDTNVFYNAYCPLEEYEPANWILGQFSSSFKGLTSEWTIIEMFRALKKQVNLGCIQDREAKIALDFFLSEIGEMRKEGVFVLKPVNFSNIIASRNTIFKHNLYATDALYITTALDSKAVLFVTYDNDFKNVIEDIPVINPLDTSFKEHITSLKKINKDS